MQLPVVASQEQSKFSQVKQGQAGDRETQSNMNDLSFTSGNPPQAPLENCSVCFSSPTKCVFLPCGHAGICESCAYDILEGQSKCCFCRQHIEMVASILPTVDPNTFKVLTAVKMQ